MSFEFDNYHEWTANGLEYYSEDGDTYVLRDCPKCDEECMTVATSETWSNILSGDLHKCIGCEYIDRFTAKFASFSVDQLVNEKSSKVSDNYMILGREMAAYIYERYPTLSNKGSDELRCSQCGEYSLDVLFFTLPKTISSNKMTGAGVQFYCQTCGSAVKSTHVLLPGSKVAQMANIMRNAFLQSDKNKD